MKVGAAIYSLLVNDSAVSAIVGTRIYPELAEEGASTPYVVYSVVSNTPVDTKDSAPVDEAQLEVFSVADTYAAANDLADKVRAALNRKGKVVYDTVTVQSVKYTNEVTEVSAERNMYVSVQDYTVRIMPTLAAPQYLLDLYSGASLAVSLRQLDFDYTGAAVKVRRASDNTEQDIGFTDYGDLDVVALQAFCSGTDGFVSKWYNQTNNADLVQTDTTKQGQIVSNGVALKSTDNLYYINCDTAQYSCSVDIPQTFTAFSAQRHLGTIRMAQGGGFLWTITSSVQKFDLGGPLLSGPTSITTGTKNLCVLVGDGANTLTRLNGAADGSGDTGTLGWSSSVAVFTGSGALNGTDQAFEMVIYGSDQTSNFAGIESNINAHYDIY